MKDRLYRLLLPLFITAFVIGVAYIGIWEWMICRVYIDPMEIMYVNSKIGEENPDPENARIVDEGVKGMQKTIYGEGRYFINPVVNDCTVTKVVSTAERVRYRPFLGIIEPLQVGMVESRSGKNPASGEFLVDSDVKNPKKGVILEPLTPGVWRLNPHAYEIKISDAIKVAPGYVGCLVSQWGSPPPKGRLAKEGEQGVMEQVLHPGIYYINPKAFSVIIVDIGYRQTPFEGINFLSKDGFNIEVDISVVWGILPEKVPIIIERFGNADDVMDKIVRPQVESLCRIEGSKYGAVELIEGISREKFQNAFTEKLVEICQNKDIQARLGLVRNITIPQNIRDPIQKSKIAAEEMNTKKEEQKTQTMENQLEKLKQEVIKGIAEVEANTEKETATILAEGDRLVAQINADQQIEVAKLSRELAEIQAEITRTIGLAENKAKELKRRAEADRLVQEIHAMGGPEAYTLYNFALNLDPNLKIFIRHTGNGTLWTDLPAGMKDLENMAAMQILQQHQQEEADRKPANKKK